DVAIAGVPASEDSRTVLTGELLHAAQILGNAIARYDHVDHVIGSRGLHHPERAFAGRQQIGALAGRQHVDIVRPRIRELSGYVTDVVFETILGATLEHNYEIRLGRRLDLGGYAQREVVH